MEKTKEPAIDEAVSVVDAAMEKLGLVIAGSEHTKQFLRGAEFGAEWQKQHTAALSAKQPEKKNMMLKPVTCTILERGSDIVYGPKSFEPKPKSPVDMFQRMLSYAGKYEISIQFWGKGNTNVFIAKDGVELHDFGNLEPEEAIEETVKYLDKINRNSIN